MNADVGLRELALLLTAFVWVLALKVDEYVYHRYFTNGSIVRAWQPDFLRSSQDYLGVDVQRNNETFARALPYGVTPGV